MVVLHADGKTSNPVVDMSPRVNALATMLGGSITFVGQYPAPLSATIMMRRDQKDKSLRVNEHVLAPPYHQDAGQLRGDIILVRMDEAAQPAELTLQEYEEFKAAAGEAKEEEEEPKASKGGKGKAKAKPTKKQGMSTEVSFYRSLLRALRNLVLSLSPCLFACVLPWCLLQEAVSYIREKRKSMGEAEPNYGDDENSEGEATPTKKQKQKQSAAVAPAGQQQKQKQAAKQSVAGKKQRK